MYVIHQILIERASGVIQKFEVSDGEQAAWLSEVSRKFQAKYVWWMRDGPEHPWKLRSKGKLTLVEVSAEGSPFAPQVVDQLLHIGRRQRVLVSPGESTRGPSSGTSGLTGPGLEKT